MDFIIDKLYQLLTDRAIIRLTGEDAGHFLQGLLTNDITKVTEQHSIYACMLTPQGKFLYDFFVSKQHGDFMLDCQKSELAEITRKLSFYKLRSDVQIIDQSNDWQLFHLTGEGQPDFQIGFAFADPRKPGFGTRAALPKVQALDYLSEQGFSLNNQGYDLTRIQAMIPEGGKDLLKDKSYPLEYGLDILNGIDFAKGCYVGQEVTARTKHRGVVRKKIYFVSDIKGESNIGCLLFYQGKKIGILCGHSSGVGLALLRIEDADALPDNCVLDLANDGDNLTTIILKK